MLLELNGLSVECIIGDLPEERIAPQRIRVDAAVEIPDTAGRTDNLSDTIDYPSLASDITAALVAAKCKMIERAALIVCEACLKDSRAVAAKAKITKYGTLDNLESVSASMEMKR